MFKLALDPFLNTGISLASLNRSGTMPVKNEAFKIICKGSDRARLRILRIETGILEGPTALQIFRFDISVSISSGVIGDKKKLSRGGGHIHS